MRAIGEWKWTCPVCSMRHEYSTEQGAVYAMRQHMAAHGLFEAGADRPRPSGIDPTVRREARMMLRELEGR